MHTHKSTIVINAPVEKIYEFFDTPKNLTAIWPSLLAVENIKYDENGDVSAYEWKYRMAGLTFSGVAQVTMLKPNESIELRTEGGIPSTFKWTFEKLTPRTTRVTVEVAYSVKTPVLGRAIEAIDDRRNHDEMERLLANLKIIFEAIAMAAE